MRFFSRFIEIHELSRLDSEPTGGDEHGALSVPPSGQYERFSALFDVLYDLTRQSLFGKAQLIRLLQIHPEFRYGVEKRRQTYCGIARVTALPFDRRFNAR